MKKEIARDLGSVIKAHTERRTLAELAAQGKRHVRVVSGRKVMALIEAIVDDAIAREAVELAEQDRERIISGTRAEFDRVMRLQSEQDTKIRKLEQLAEARLQEIEESRTRAESLETELERARDRRGNREARLVAESMRRIEDAEKQTRSAREAAEAAARRAEDAEEELDSLRGRLDEAQARIEDRDSEIQRLGEVLAEDRERVRALESERRQMISRFESERGDLAGRQESAISELKTKLEKAETGQVQADRRRVRAERAFRRLQARAAQEEAEMREAAEAASLRLEESKTALAAARERIQGLTEERRSLEDRLLDLENTRTREGGEAVGRLRRDVEELKSLVHCLSERPAGLDESSVHTLMARLGEREDQLQGRFTFQMDQTVAEITRALHEATARPVDEPVEATDVLVDRVFDRENEMRTNLDVLTVEELTSEGGIATHLELLKAARKGVGNETPTEGAAPGRESHVQ